MTRIGASVVIHGDVTASEALQIDGEVRGRIEARDGLLTLGPAARIEADVAGMEVLVLGQVRGNLTASRRIELGATADVSGTLSASHVVLADGARFSGRIDMGQRTIAAKVAAHRATQEPA